MNESQSLLKVEDVNIVSEQISSGRFKGLVVREASFSLGHGGSLGIAGESGSGKTTLVQSLFGYARQGLKPITGVVEFQGREMPVARPEGFIDLRGKDLSFVPQSAHSMLNPLMTVGQQLDEICGIAKIDDRATRAERVLKLLRELGFSAPETILNRYPHELSGGQRQRVALCMALLPEPAVLVMDEATSDLDALTQLRILKLIRDVKERLGFGLIVVSHDLRILTALCEDLLVMYQGIVVESGPLKDLVAAPGHPYTAHLVKRYTEGPIVPAGALHARGVADERETGCVYRANCPMAQVKCLDAPSIERLDESRETRCWFGHDVTDFFGITPVRPEVDEEIWRRTKASVRANPRGEPVDGNNEVLRVENLIATHKGSGMLNRRSIEVLHGINLRVRAGETVGVVGESGSGKTTLARVIVGLHTSHSGDLRYGDFDLSIPAHKRPLWVRRELQIIFQNPETALNPRLNVGDILGRRIRLFETRRGEKSIASRVKDLLTSVGLPPAQADRRSDQLSGGEKQRVAIARALIGDPQVVVCDEILSSLDVITQSRIIQLMLRLQAERRLALVFISHDIGVTAALADRIVVFKDGAMREQGRAANVLWHPEDEYTKSLVSSSIVSMDDAQLSGSVGAE